MTPFDDFIARSIPAFPRHGSGIQLVNVSTGEEIKPGDTIPEPYGQGEITYVGPTAHDEGDGGPLRPGRVAVVQYTTPDTDWVFWPSQLGARYVDATHERISEPPAVEGEAGTATT